MVGGMQQQQQARLVSFLLTSLNNERANRRFMYRSILNDKTPERKPMETNCGVAGKRKKENREKKEVAWKNIFPEKKLSSLNLSTQ